jgi:hypothetical protein
MNNLTKALLGGTALCALAAAPALAQDVPAFRVTALHAGNVVNKTQLHDPGRVHKTYTFSGISTYVPASDLDVTVTLPATSYGFHSSCAKAKVKARFKPKKTEFAILGADVESNAGYCVVSDTYELDNPAGEGQTDRFVSSVSANYESGGVKYRGTLNLDVTVDIGQ